MKMNVTKRKNREWLDQFGFFVCTLRHTEDFKNYEKYECKK